MPLSDLSPLSYFKELHLLPRVIFTIGGAFFFGGLFIKAGDQRVMVFTGDGGFQMTALCVVTQTRFGLNPIIFVIDNGVFAVEQWLADASVFSAPAAPFKEGLDVHRCSYSEMSAVVNDPERLRYHCKGWKVTTYRELDNAMTGALANLEGPSIILVVVDPKSIPKNAEWKAKIDMEKKSKMIARNNSRLLYLECAQ